MNDTKKAVEKLEIDKVLYFIPIILILSACVYLGFNLEKANDIINAVFAYITGNFSWFYQFFTFACVAVCMYLIFGKYGSMRFGDEKPEFSNFSWISMIFTAALGGSVVLWATIESFYYVMGPPFGVEPFSYEAYRWATTYPYFHWGFTGNSMYCALGVTFAYMFWVRKKDVNRASSACSLVLGEKITAGWLGKVIDILLIISIVGGIATTLGLSTPLASELIVSLFGIPHTLSMDIVLIVFWIITISFCVYSGLNKGIRIISNVRMWLMFGILGFVFLVGPKVFMLNNFCEGIGNMMNDFFKMSFYTEPYGNKDFNGFPQWWTIFYWAWWAGYASQMGIYFARISRGRTVRAFCLAILGATGLGVWIFFAVFGNYTLHGFINGKLPLLPDILNNAGNAAAVVHVWESMPVPTLFLFAMLLLTLIATITLMNGAAYTLAMLSTKKLSGKQEPAGWNRISWAFVLGILALILMAIGGLKAVQTSSILVSFPMLFIFIVIIAGFFKVTREDNWGNLFGETTQNVVIKIDSESTNM
jgi:L-carnitine/gamma-butyrobetaine antiporter